MQNLFYFEQEKTLCWVAGYTKDGNTSNVIEIINAIKECAQEFATFAGVDIGKVNTLYVVKSRRYKYMRVFYAVVEFENVPIDEVSFVFKADGTYKTMHNWLFD